KLEVRFRDSSLVHSTILRSIRDALRAADLTPTFHAPGFGSRPGGDRAILPSSSGGESSGGGGGGAAATASPSTPPGATSAFAAYFNRPHPASTAPGERFNYAAIREAIDAAGPVAGP